MAHACILIGSLMAVFNLLIPKEYQNIREFYLCVSFSLMVGGWVAYACNT
jgi:hypothetical protein